MNTQQTPVPKKCTLIPGEKSLIDDKTLQKVIQWDIFGEDLGIEYHQLMILKGENTGHEVYRRAILRHWYNSKVRCCWEDVIEALMKREMNKLAKELADSYDVKFIFIS